MCIFPSPTTWSETMYHFSAEVHLVSFLVAMKYHLHDFILYCLPVRALDLMWEIELDGKEFPYAPYIEFQSALQPRYMSHPTAFGNFRWIVLLINTYVAGFESHTVSKKTWKKCCLPNPGHIYICDYKKPGADNTIFSAEILSNMKNLGKI